MKFGRRTIDGSKRLRNAFSGIAGLPLITFLVHFFSCGAVCGVRAKSRVEEASGTVTHRPRRVRLRFLHFHDFYAGHFHSRVAGLRAVLIDTVAPAR